MSLYYKLLKAFYKEQGGFPDFTPQFRIEGRARKEDNTNALAMRTADPLWMLGRQWQFGEFVGEDNGSPIRVQAHYRKEKSAYYSTPDAERQPLNNVPLEAVVEGIPMPRFDLKSRVRIGQQYERLIKKAFSKAKATSFVKDLRMQFPLSHEWMTDEDIGQLDRKSRRFFQLMQGKVIDGNLLFLDLKDSDYPLESEHADFADLQPVTGAFMEWFTAFFGEQATDNQAWDSRQLSHKFDLHQNKETGASEQFTLSAPDYQSGHLDWYAFDKAAVKIQLDDTNKEVVLKDLPPVNVSFPSMPDKRLFSFEDSKIDISQMDVDAADLLKLMLIDFSLVSGSDWYTVPIPMDLGELCWIKQIEVMDVFGVKTTIQNNEEKGAFIHENPLKVWDVFKIRDDSPKDYEAAKHFLFLAPASTHKMESAPVEELLFMRDEYANMVWAVEKTIPNAMGNAVDGFDLHLEKYGPFIPLEDADAENDVPKFRLANTVPSNWIPYLPKHIEANAKEIELVRAYMLRNDDSDEPTDIEPLTFLAAKDVLQVREEAIPRAGVRVQLTKHRIRWTDGKTYVWMGRKVLGGRGEGESGLKFDYLKK